MRKPTFALLSALVVACGSSSSTSDSSGSGAGTSGSGASSGSHGSGNSGAGGTGSATTGGSGSGNSTGTASTGSVGSGGSGMSDMTGSSTGGGELDASLDGASAMDASIEGGGAMDARIDGSSQADASGGATGCPSQIPTFNMPCTPFDGGTCVYGTGRPGGGGASCSCSLQTDAGYAWSCLFTAGRRPHGFDGVVDARDQDALPNHLATAAGLEAASVTAFRMLRRELRAHGAPRRLLRQASRAARDERRHARRVGALARRWGAEGRPQEVSTHEVRPLADIAIENAVEGCVRETFGALVAAWQATFARDSDVRATMRDIARDETRHAALAWEVARWADQRLDPTDRRRVAAACRSAIETLKTEVSREPPSVVVRTLGWPTAAQAERLLAGMVDSLRIVAVG